ncbi:MAG: hypothetical protein HKN76_12430 [Saprospiraceae bacterium]|nr:hypothetical protein [Saprospiraceae bacterium]
MLDKISQSLNRFFTPNRISLSVCLVVAIAGWFLTKMSKVYTHQLTYTLKYALPTNATFDQNPPVRLDVDLRASGWSLLSLIRENDSIEVIASELSGKPTSAKIFLSEKLGQWAGDELNLITTDPEQIQFTLVEKESKKVPVILNGDLVLDPQFEWREPVKIEPDSITIFGSSQHLAETTSWSTRSFSKTNISKDFTERIALEKSSLALETDSSHIWLTGSVDQITEKEIYVPIQVADSLKGNISIFPDQALVKVNLGLRHYDQIEVSEFLLIAEPDPSDPGSLRVVVKEYPDFVTYLAHTPESVDYLRSNP